MSTALIRLFKKAAADGEPRWQTSSLPGDPAPSAAEIDALGEQLSECEASRGCLFVFGGWLDEARAFLRAHLITAVVVVALLSAGLAFLVGAA
jgi:hypothetical protein